MSQPTLGAVAIGRNEGERLKACLRSLVPLCDRVVYVDSGSSDDSVAFARSLGVVVVELDQDRPFTAARARNAGFAALAQSGALPDLVQFVDGDCRVEPDWLDKGRAHLQANPQLGLVTGWRSEIFPDASAYNSLFQADWLRPAGIIKTCGGDMMVRSGAFQEIGGFNPEVIAAEDDDFCLRLGKAGWGLERLPVQMTWHDAAMTRFGPWWRRSTRDGHGFAQVGHLHPEHFRRERLRAWIYGLALPVLFLLGLVVWPWLSVGVALLYLLSYLRTFQGFAQRAPVKRRLPFQVGLLTLSKIPNVIGMLTYLRRRQAGSDMKLIEYK